MMIQLLMHSAQTIPFDLRLTSLKGEHPTANFVVAVVDAEINFDSLNAWDDHMKVEHRTTTPSSQSSQFSLFAAYECEGDARADGVRQFFYRCMEGTNDE
jgi:hypothetical protein